MASVTTASAAQLDTLCINTIRTLSMDGVQQANSGHPGTPMAMAPVAYELWQEFLRFDPEDAAWPNRDRFVLSIGHASMLIYSMLHLTGVKQLDSANKPTDKLAVPLDDIKRFRQLESRCPGHPEYRWTSGVETTTGPLGQGVANSVGMAIAERWLAKHFNRPGFELFLASHESVELLTNAPSHGTSSRSWKSTIAAQHGCIVTPATSAANRCGPSNTADCGAGRDITR